MRQASAAAVFLTILCCAPARQQSPNSASLRPSVILITVDTLRADHLSSYRQGRAKTPGMDALSSQGILFENAITPAPLTLPAHCSLMTGTLPIAHGVRDNSGFTLPDSAETLAEILASDGYDTGAFVGAYVLDSRFGLSQGFQRYYDEFEPEAAGGPTMEILERPASRVLAAAREWIAGRNDKPFFAWIHLFDPHTPYRPPQGPASYAGEVEYVDAQLDAFWTFLRTRGVFDSSLVALTSDHGEGLGEHGEATHGMFLYDSTLRVPLIFKLPEAKSGMRIPAAVRLIDVMPTILDVVSLPTPASVQGVSLRTAWEKGSMDDLPALSETLLPLLNYGWSDIASYRAGKHKLISAPRPELYDLAKDPGETSNLLPGNQSLANGLKSEERQLRNRFTGDASALAWRTPDAESMERLRSLGYAALARPSGNGREDPIQTLRDALGSPLADPKDKINAFNGLWEAQAASTAGDHARSNRILERVLEDDPNMFMAHSIRALNLLRMKRPKEAVRSLRKAAELRPEDPGARLYLSLAELETGNLTAAAEGFELTLQLDPESDAARNNLATVYARLKEYGKATALLEELSRRNPRDPAAPLNLGVVHMMQSQPTPALSAFEEALRRNPEIPEAYNNIGLLHLRQGDAKAALPALLRAVELRPDYSNARLNLASAYRMLGRQREAEEQLRLAERPGVRP